LIARVLQGVGAASSRVLTMSIVRDCYEGNPMARVMSLSFMVFLMVPILAPSIGQLILLVAAWQWVFSVLALFGLAVLLWVTLRLPETLPAGARRPIEWRSLWQGLRSTVQDAQSMGYTLASTVMLGALFGFINCAPQVFVDVFHVGRLFPLFFAGIAASVAAASLLNSRIVERLGTHRVAHGALIGFALLACVHALVALAGAETLWTFALLQAAMMFCFGLAVGNFGAMAMAGLGHVAGMASSVQGFISTVLGAALGFLVGQQFDGSTVPLTIGYAVLGLLALAIVLATERGLLFRNRTGHSDGRVAMAH
jgi:DHA1 family bicyclomycin/chloramphenicol resistance-like MFS transporter